jgi:hypothetical protein
MHVGRAGINNQKSQIAVNAFLKVKHELKAEQSSKGYGTEHPSRRYVLDMNPTWLRHEASCDPIPPDVFYHSPVSRVTKKKKKYLACN